MRPQPHQKQEIAKMLAQQFEAYISEIANGGYLDDLSDTALIAYTKQIDPLSIVTLQPSMLPDDNGEYLVEFSDGSTGHFNRYDTTI